MSAAIGQTAVGLLPVHRPALAAEPRFRPPGRFGGRPAVRFFQQPVGQDEAGAVLGGGGGPDGVILAVVVLGGVAMLEASKLVLRSLGEFQLLVVFLEEVLAAATARQHREEGVVVTTGVLLLALAQ